MIAAPVSQQQERGDRRLRPPLLRQHNPRLRRPNRGEKAVTYLIVGLDKQTLVPWHCNVCASDGATARLMARARAAAQGIDVVVAAVIGPNLSILSEPNDQRATPYKAA
jgi:hypothetical protein